MFSPKVLLISAVVLFTALGLKVSLPFATTRLPLLWSFFLLCFKPPYIYVIVNAIIISIVASSRFHRFDPEHNHTLEPTPPPLPSYEIEMKSPHHFTVPEPPVLEVKPVMVNGSAALEEEEEERTEIDQGMALMRMESTEIQSPTEKPLISARFGHRKPLKSSSEGGRALRVVARPKRHETLENTWKAITEGRPMPLSRHVKKCDTWHDRGSKDPLEVSSTVEKSETFKDRTNRPPPVSKLRKEPSLSQDELNRRVEAFIQKFNQEMRLQRQESLNQFMQMINRDT